VIIARFLRFIFLRVFIFFSNLCDAVKIFSRRMKETKNEKSEWGKFVDKFIRYRKNGQAPRRYHKTRLLPRQAPVTISSNVPPIEKTESTPTKTDGIPTDSEKLRQITLVSEHKAAMECIDRIEESRGYVVRCLNNVCAEYKEIVLENFRIRKIALENPELFVPSSQTYIGQELYTSCAKACDGILHNLFHLVKERTVLSLPDEIIEQIIMETKRDTGGDRLLARWWLSLRLVHSRFNKVITNIGSFFMVLYGEKGINCN
jgi:hypothetical protein